MPNETTALQVAAAPCKSCPYRRDVPSGVWAREEYDKLPLYDGEIAEQAMRGAFAMFYCHQKDGRLCAGWVGAHGADNLLAMRLNAERLDQAVWGYRSPLSVFGSGREASAHGKRSIRRPKADAQRIIRRLSRKMAATTMTDQTTGWRPINNAPRNELVYVRGPDLEEQPSEWGKVSHVPLYGWLNMTFDDPEDITVLVPQPTEWMPLADYDAP